MAESLGEVLLSLRTRDDGFSRGIDNAKRKAENLDKGFETSVKNIGRELDSLVGGPLTRLTAGLGPLAIGGAVTAGVVGGLAAIVQHTATVGDELAKLSVRTGLTVESLSALKVAAELNDTSLQSLGQSLRFMQINVAQAARGAGEAEGVLRAMGFTMDEMRRAASDPEGFLDAFAQRLGQIRDVGQRTEAAFRVFGRSAQDLMPLLNDLSQRGMAGVRAEAERLGVVMSTDAARAAEQFNDDLSRLRFMAQSLAITIGNTLIPQINNLLQALLNPRQAALQFSRGILESLKDAMRGPLGVSEFLLEQLPEALRSRLREAQGGIKEDLDALIAELDRSLAGFEDVAARPTPLGPQLVLGDLERAGGGRGRRGVDDAKKRADEIQRIFEATRTPLEAFHLEVQRLQALRLPDDLLGRAVAQAAQALADATPEFVAFNAAQERAGTILAAIQTPFERFQTRLAELEQLQPHLSTEQFGRAVGQLANELAQTDAALQDFQEAQIRGAQLAASLRTPYEQFNETIRELADLLMQGAISQETFDRAVTQGVVTVRKATEDTRELDQAARSFALTFASSFEDAIFSGERFSDVLVGLLDDIARLAFRLAITAPLINLFQGLFSNVAPASAPGISAGFFSLPRAQHGLNFRVGGSGGIDSQLVQFMATPGERVMAIPPGQSLGGSVVHIHNYSGAPVSQERRQGTGGQEEIHVLIGRAVAKEMGRPGSAPNTVLRGGGWNHGLIGR